MALLHTNHQLSSARGNRTRQLDPRSDYLISKHLEEYQLGLDVLYGAVARPVNAESERTSILCHHLEDGVDEATRTDSCLRRELVAPSAARAIRSSVSPVSGAAVAFSSFAYRRLLTGWRIRRRAVDGRRQGGRRHDALYEDPYPPRRTPLRVGS